MNETGGAAVVMLLNIVYNTAGQTNDELVSG